LDPAVSRRNVADERRLLALESLADRELTDQECIRNWAAHRRPSDGLDGTLVGAARPVLWQPRVVAMVQMLLDLIVLGLLIRLVLGAVQTSQRRRAATRAGGDAAVEAGDPR